jgi:hypothetical protein
MRAGLVAIQAGLIVAAISSLPESALAGSCTCTCVGSRSMDSPRDYSLSMGKCTDLNGRYCELTATDPAGRAAGSRVSGSLQNCSGSWQSDWDPKSGLFNNRK